MSAVQIRTLESADVSAVLKVWNRALKRDPMNEGRFIGGVLCDADYWPGDDSGFFVAAHAGRPVGFLRAIIRRHSNDRVGVEPELGWIPVVAVDPEHRRGGVGTALMNAAIGHFKRHNRKRIWVCGNTGSAPGYVFPGVDKDAYAGGLTWFHKMGFRIDHESIAMARGTFDFDVAAFTAESRAGGTAVQIMGLTADRVQDFFSFLAEAFPGDWNTAARMKVRSGALGEVLIALLDGRVVGYCQWEGEHFGPFGVRPEVRNRKVGAQLFVEAVRRIRAADGRTVWFNWADDDVARFYGRFGLTATRQFAILVKDL
ncbi:MAG: GNAT family N-acetyltransferase [Phycisphaerae bacterium]|nr:GNAT family N-acetyltransferase [Phycisphaerae bacterium]